MDIVYPHVYYGNEILDFHLMQWHFGCFESNIKKSGKFNDELMTLNQGGGTLGL